MYRELSDEIKFIKSEVINVIKSEERICRRDLSTYKRDSNKLNDESSNL